MFGLLIPQRPIQPNPHEVLSPTQFKFEVTAQPPFSHFAIFMLPGQDLPINTVAAVYVNHLGTPARPFKLAGALTMEKQTALFRLGDSSEVDDGVREEPMLDGMSGSEALVPPMGGSIVIGVSIEPAAQIQAQLSTPHIQASFARSRPPRTPDSAYKQDSLLAPANVKEIARRVGQNAYNYLTGFVEGSSGGEVVSLKRVEEWWTKLEKKLELDTTFLTKGQEAS